MTQPALVDSVMFCRDTESYLPIQWPTVTVFFTQERIRLVAVCHVPGLAFVVDLFTDTVGNQSQ